VGSLAPFPHEDSAWNATNNSKLLVFKALVKGFGDQLKVLVDSGASDNFISKQVAMQHPEYEQIKNSTTDSITIRLANGSLVTTAMIVIKLPIEFSGFKCNEDLIVLDMSYKYDLILGMPWLEKHQPWINWRTKEIGPSSDMGIRREVMTPVAYSISSSMQVNADTAVPDPLSEAGSTSEADQEGNQEGRHYNSVGAAVGSEVAPPELRESDEIPLVQDGGRVPDVLPFIRDEVMSQSSERSQSIVHDGGSRGLCCETTELSTRAEELLSLPEMSYDDFLADLKEGNIAELWAIVPIENDGEDGQNALLFTSSTEDPSVLIGDTKHDRYQAQSWDHLKRTSPYYDLVREFEDCFPEEVPPQLPPERDVVHEIDLVPGTKYCVTRQWPLPKEQVDVIDEFFSKKLAAGQVRESNSPHCSPTFCVRKPTGGWRIVHAYNKLNAATIPAQTPIPRRDEIIDEMSGSTEFSTVDLRDGYYQIRVRHEDISKTAVSTPSGMLYEWLVMPQGLSNAPATFNRLITNIFRPYRRYCRTYFDDIFIFSRAENGKTAVDVHREHLRVVFKSMRDHKLYANLKKCIFGAPEIPVLGCFVGRNGVRPDPEKLQAISKWPVPTNLKELRSWLGMANYLHRFCKNYADKARPLNELLKKSQCWTWTSDHQKAFDTIKQSLIDSPVLALPDYDRPFHIVCDASDFAIGCALMQVDAEGKERVVSYQSRKLKAAELNYPVHDKELLSIKYALVKFRVYLLGPRPFVVYTDHASLTTAMKTPHLSSRLARWQSFFAEYTFTVKHKPGRTNVVADALSRRPDYEKDANQISTSSPSVKSFDDEIRQAYADDPKCRQIMQALNAKQTDRVKVDRSVKASLHRYTMTDGLLYYQLTPGDSPRVVIPASEDLKHKILYEYHDSHVAGHPGRDKTLVAVSAHFYWKKMFKWIKRYVATCEICQRVKPSQTGSAPLQSLPVPADCWQSVSLDFIFGLPKDTQNRTGILVFVCRLSKMIHLVPVKESVTAKQCARIFMDTIFRLHGLPKTLVSDRDPRFTAAFWSELFKLLGTDLAMSTAAHPQTDGQTERANRVVEDVLRGMASEHPKKWSDYLPLVEFSINNSVHSTTGVSPFYINSMRDPLVPLMLRDNHELMTKLKSVKTKGLSHFVSERQAVLQRVRERMAESQDKQKQYADMKGRNNINIFNVGDLVLLSTKDLPKTALPSLEANKLQPRFLGPFKVVKRIGKVSYRLDIPSYLRLHPTFYVGKLKAYTPPPPEIEAELPESETRSALNDQPRSPASPTNIVAERSSRVVAEQQSACEQAMPEAISPPDSAPQGAARANHLRNGIGHQRTGETSEASHKARCNAHSPLRLEHGSQLTSQAVQNSYRSASSFSPQRSKNVHNPGLISLRESTGHGPYNEDKSKKERTHTRRRNHPPALLHADGVQRHIVEHIVAKRNIRGRQQLLVKWLGYGNPSWEPYDVMMQDIPDLVREFEARRS